MAENSDSAVDDTIGRIKAERDARHVTLRDRFAIAIITGVAGGWLKDDGARRELARRAYLMADVMVEERAGGS